MNVLEVWGCSFLLTLENGTLAETGVKLFIGWGGGNPGAGNNEGTNEIGRRKKGGRYIPPQPINNEAFLISDKDFIQV